MNTVVHSFLARVRAYIPIVVCLSVDYVRKIYPIDLKFSTQVEYSKLGTKFEDERNLWKIKIVVVLPYPPQLLAKT